MFAAANTLCIHGAAKKNWLCSELVLEHARAVALRGGHHVGDYAALATLILDAMPR
jgi:type IV secretory pathway VirJ component